MQKKYFRSMKPLQAWQQIFLAIFLGMVCGLVIGPKCIYLKPIGILFIHAIQMMVVPVVFTSVVCAIISVDSLDKMRRLGLKAIMLYSISMAVAAFIGLMVAVLLKPGAGFMLTETMSLSAPRTITFLEVISNIIPANPVAAFSSGNILQILVFAILLGASVNLSGAKGELIAEFFKSFSSVTIKLVQLVMKFAPLGIFALMAWAAGEHGAQVLLPLFKFVFAVYLACFLLVVFFYGFTLMLYTQKNPLTFFKQISEAMLLAFSTSSSAATLPVTMACAEKKLGIAKSLSAFLLPLGATMNLNGLSIYLSVSTVFAANIYGIELTFTQYLTVIVTIILTSMGAGGIPGSALMVMSAVMNAVGIPLGAIPLIAGVDRLNDMAQTTTNVTGDLYSVVMIAKSEKVINEKTAVEKVAIEKEVVEKAVTEKKEIEKAVRYF